jgi:Ni/Fe-hydrogenase subunit HybB-like protein
VFFPYACYETCRGPGEFNVGVVQVVELVCLTIYLWTPARLSGVVRFSSAQKKSSLLLLLFYFGRKINIKES